MASAGSQGLALGGRDAELEDMAQDPQRLGQPDSRKYSIRAPQQGQTQDWHHRGMCKGLVSERDLNSHVCDLQRCTLAQAGKRISAGQAHTTVSEVRHAPYLHDRHHPDHAVFACCWRSAMSGGDRVIRWSTAFAVLGVAAVAAVASYEHAYDLVRAHGETGWTARLVPLTVDGLIYASSMVMLDSARRKTPVPALSRWLLGLGIAATLAADVAHGLGHGLIGAAVAAWPAGRAGRLV